MIAARWLALAAVLGGLVGVVYFPLHSLAYFGTGEPQGAVKWADGGRDLLEPLLDWGSADHVYKTYGKVGVLVVLGFLCGLIALRTHRGSAPRGLERWGFRVAFVGYPLVVLGTIVEYFTPYLDFGFMAFTGPGFLLTLIGSTLLGVALLRTRAAPRVPAILLAACVPLTLVLVGLLGHLSAGLLPLDLAWIGLGAWLWSRHSLRRSVGILSP